MYLRFSSYVLHAVCAIPASFLSALKPPNIVQRCSARVRRQFTGGESSSKRSKGCDGVSTAGEGGGSCRFDTREPRVLPPPLFLPFASLPPSPRPYVTLSGCTWCSGLFMLGPLSFSRIFVLRRQRQTCLRRLLSARQQHDSASGCQSKSVSACPSTARY